MKKRTLTILIAVVLVVACAVGGTLAWLTATSGPVTNTFTAGDINITLTETTGNEYKMVPGYTITKDPTVTVTTGSEACYLFVQAVKSANFDTFLTYTIADGWTELDGVPGVYYRVVQSSNMGTAISVIKNNEVEVKDTVTKSDLTGLTTGTYPTLTFNAYAVQLNKDNNTTFTPAEAWTNAQAAASN